MNTLHFKTFENEDHTLGALLQYELLGNPQISFVGYKTPDPQAKRIELKMITRRSCTSQELDAIVKGALRDLLAKVQTMEQNYIHALDKFYQQYIFYAITKEKMNGEVCPNARFVGPPGFTSRGNPFTNVYGSDSGFDTDSYRKYCFQPAFVTPCAANTVNCITGYDHRGSCYYGAECRSGNCRNGMCISSFDNNNAKVVSSLSHSDFVKYANAANDSSGRPPDERCAVGAVCKQGMVLADVGGNRREVLCPLPNPAHSQPQYQQALMRVWQPDRFKDSDPEAYRVAKDLQSCFFQDVQYPNGTTAPVAVKMTPKCLAAAQAAIEQVAYLGTTCNPSQTNNSYCR